jgi:DNA-binding NarL/FixJ family response regulator
MATQSQTCALLAERHSILSEGIRGLLEAMFGTTYIVADIPSLKEGAQRLAPAVIVLDLSMMGDDFPSELQQVLALSPRSRVIVLSVHDQPSVARLALAAGAQGVIIKRKIGSDFLSAVSAVLRGEEFLSDEFGLAATKH